MSAFAKLLDLLNKLDDAHISFDVKHVRAETVMVLVHLPAEYWEVEFFENGQVEIEIYTSLNGVVGGEELLGWLFDDSSDAEQRARFFAAIS